MAASFELISLLEVSENVLSRGFSFNLGFWAYVKCENKVYLTSGNDVMIFQILSPKKIGEKIGVFDSKQS
jgi:hypothetical protein